LDGKRQVKLTEPISITGFRNKIDFLVSENFIDELGMQNVFHINSLGKFALKGKDKPVEIVSGSDIGVMN